MKTKTLSIRPSRSEAKLIMLPKGATFFLFILASLFTLYSGFLAHIPSLLALEAGWNITAPSSVSFPSFGWSLSQGTTTVEFGTAVVVSNDSSTTLGFTGQVTSTELIHSTDASLFIGYTKLDIKTGTITTSQSDGVTAPLNGTYSTFSGVLATSDPINFMVADARNRNAGSWSITPTLRLTIPAKQRAGTYNSTMTFSLI